MKIYKREKYLKKIRPFYDSDIIKIITGIRRCGKSCLMKLIIEELKEKGVDDAHIIYLPLDKRGFKMISTPDELEKKIDEKICDNGFYYLFIDEVQNVKGFEKVIQAFQEEENFSIFLTGSNSYLLSDEISTKLTGRYLSFEIFTLDFYEYLEMKKFRGKQISENLQTELTEYIQNGGFPKSLEFDTNETKSFYTRSIIEEIFEKDIKKRNKIRNKSVFERVQNYIINNYSSTFSLNKVYDYFRNVENVHITKITLRNYIDILEKAKIIYKCKRFDQKSKKSLSGEHKFYLGDLSIYYAMNVDNRINYGSSLENLVYIHLISNDYRVSIGKIGNLECDFISRNVNNDYAYIQVTQTMVDSKTEEREYRPFKYIKDGYPRYILSLDLLKNQKDGIHHIDIVDVLLNKKNI